MAVRTKAELAGIIAAMIDSGGDPGITAEDLRGVLGDAVDTFPTEAAVNAETDGLGIRVEAVEEGVDHLLAGRLGYVWRYAIGKTQNFVGTDFRHLLLSTHSPYPQLDLPEFSDSDYFGAIAVPLDAPEGNFSTRTYRRRGGPDLHTRRRSERSPGPAQALDNPAVPFALQQRQAVGPRSATAPLAIRALHRGDGGRRGAPGRRRLAPVEQPRSFRPGFSTAARAMSISPCRTAGRRRRTFAPRPGTRPTSSRNFPRAPSGSSPARAVRIKSIRRRLFPPRHIRRWISSCCPSAPASRTGSPRPISLPSTSVSIGARGTSAFLGPWPRARSYTLPGRRQTISRKRTSWPDTRGPAAP